MCGSTIACDVPLNAFGALSGPASGMSSSFSAGSHRILRRDRHAIEHRAGAELAIDDRAPQIDLAAEREAPVRLGALPGARALNRVLDVLGPHRHRSGRADAGDVADLRDHRLDPRVDRRGHQHHRAAVARSPQADAIGIDAGLALQIRHRGAEVLDLAEVVQVGALGLDAEPPRRVVAREFAAPRGQGSRLALDVWRGIGLEQAQIAAAESVGAVVNGHRHQPAPGEAGGVLLDADRQRVDAVPHHHRGMRRLRGEALRQEQLAVERRPAVHVERHLPRRDALGQDVVPVLRLGAALALHRRVGGLRRQIRAVAFDDVGADLRRGRRGHRRHGQRRGSGASGASS